MFHRRCAILPDDFESGHQGGEGPALGAIRIMTSMVMGRRIDQVWAWRAPISGFLKRAPDLQSAFKAFRENWEV